MLLCCKYDDLITLNDNSDYQGTRFVLSVYFVEANWEKITRKRSRRRRKKKKKQDVEKNIEKK